MMSPWKHAHTLKRCMKARQGSLAYEQVSITSERPMKKKWWRIHHARMCDPLERSTDSRSASAE